MNKYLAGTVAGFIATGPMTAVMELLHRKLPSSQRYPLPPREGTMQVVKALGLKQHLNEPERVGVTIASHFATGAALGTLYGAVQDKVAVPPVVKGAAFGIMAWGANYLGFLPATGVLSSAAKHPAQRNVLMITAHLVWGITAALLIERLTRKNNDSA